MVAFAQSGSLQREAPSRCATRGRRSRDQSIGNAGDAGGGLPNRHSGTCARKEVLALFNCSSTSAYMQPCAVGIRMAIHAADRTDYPRTPSFASPRPLLIVAHGQVRASLLQPLLSDARIESIDARSAGSGWVTLAHRLPGVLVATEHDPLNALVYAITAGVRSRVVVASLRRHQSQWKDVRAAGAAAVVGLPPHRRDLERLVRVLQNEAAVQLEPRLRLLLDPIARLVWFRGRAVNLTPREFSLLHALTSNTGQAVSSDELHRRVWGSAPTGGKSRQLLPLYVFQLRRKLSELGLRDALTTVRDYGYGLAHTSPPT